MGSLPTHISHWSAPKDGRRTCCGHTHDICCALLHLVHAVILPINSSCRDTQKGCTITQPVKHALTLTHVNKLQAGLSSSRLWMAPHMVTAYIRPRDRGTHWVTVGKHMLILGCVNVTKQSRELAAIIGLLRLVCPGMRYVCLQCHSTVFLCYIKLCQSRDC